MVKSGEDTPLTWPWENPCRKLWDCPTRQTWRKTRRKRIMKTYAGYRMNYSNYLISLMMTMGVKVSDL